MTATKKQTAADLAQMFVQQAIERGRVDDGGEGSWWSHFYLTERQAEWFLSVYEREQEAKFGRSRKRSPWSGVQSLTVGDLHCCWGDRFRNGTLQIEFQSVAATAARSKADRARHDAEDAAWEAEQKGGA